MASLAESSVGSIPISDLLRVQEQLLRHREPSPNALGQTLSEANTAQENTNDEHSDDQIPDTDDVNREIPNSANATIIHSQVPQMTPSKPTQDLETDVVQATPSQEAFKTLTRADSFDGFPGGDTQPMETQVYRDYSESMMKRDTPEADTEERDHRSEKESNAPTDEGAVGASPNTYAEGDTGYINLHQAWQASGPCSESDIEELLAASPETQIQLPTTSNEGLGAELPETPGLAGNKHGRNGELLTSAATKTPGYSQFFPGMKSGPGLSATQLFNQTQAHSSPMGDVPYSDPIVTRPSPNINQQAIVSSPSAFMSSPMATMHNRPAAAGFVGPRENYSTMLESQERRSRGNIERDNGEDYLNEDDEEEEDSVRRLHERKRLKRIRSDQALNELGRVKAPSRPGSRQTSSGQPSHTIDLVTPAASKKIAQVDYTPFNDEEEDTEDEAPINEDDHENIADQDEENDVYDELAQTVLRSQPNPEDDAEITESIEGSVKSDNEEDHNEEDGNMETDSPKHGHVHDRIGLDSDRIVTNTQPSAIADSQPFELSQNRTGLARTGNTRSSMASYIPGSQYAGKTSQDRAFLVSSGPRAPASQPNMRTMSNTVPGSSPLPGNNTPPPASVAEGNRVEFQRPIRHEIPESDSLDAESLGPAPKQFSRRRQEATESNDDHAPLYSTAQTHASDSPRKPIPELTSQNSKLTEPSPRKAAGARYLSDIANDPVGSGHSQTMHDIDSIMEKVMAENEEFMEAISSPQKPKQQYRPRRLQRLPPSSVDSAAPSQSEKPVESTERAESTPETTEAPVNEVAESPKEDQDHTAATPEAEEPPQTTQDSVKKREEAGAQAVAELLSTRSAKKIQAMKSAKPKKGAKQKEYSTKSSRLRSNMKETSKAEPKARKQDRKTNNKDDSRKSTPDPLAEEPSLDAAVKSKITELTGDQTLASAAPNRVMALFKGSYNNFYPATWLGSSLDNSHQKVRFDDTTVTDIETQHVRSLDLRIGDPIKVDLKGLRNKTWVVQNFGPVAQTDEDRALGTDVYGRVMVRVQASSGGRASLAGNARAEDTNGEVVDVLITNTYVTHTMWPHFSDRAFSPPKRNSRTNSREETPTAGMGTPITATPGSRSRRATTTMGTSGNAHTSLLRDESVASAGYRSRDRLFDGMVFSISYTKNTAEKSSIINLIGKHGGAVLESGFDELFDLPNMDEISPSNTNASSNLQLKPEYKERGFVALIADQHSRRAKYMQALALGLPTLSGKWITDSLDPLKNVSLATENSDPLPWSRYLLPAGESAYLDGAVRSRSMPSMNTLNPRLVDTIGARDLLLGGDGVLIIGPKNGNSWGKRIAYAFLTVAVGASKVKRINDLAEAKRWINDEPENWQWVYVDDSVDNGSIAKASATLFGKKSAANNKRKRNEKGDADTWVASDGKIKVVNDEFVIQSLILGALVG